MKEKILALIESNREGETWDFKQKYHANKASLIHDILAMTNQSNDEIRYIIFGVSDPAEGTKVVGLEEDENRRDQNSIISILRCISFSGDIRPRIELITLFIEEKAVDVLKIFPINDVPCFLRSDYRDEGKVVKANYIYTRVGDTNTPIDKSCDLFILERLWRKRFGIDKTSIERFKYLLDDFQNWHMDLGNDSVAYHKYSPEYRIDFGDIKEFFEPFSATYPNPKSYLGTLELKFHNTVLYKTEYWCLDEMRLYIPAARIGNIRSIESGHYWYFLKDDINGKLLKLFTEGNMDLSSRGSGGSQFVIYEDESERVSFEDFVEKNPHELESVKPSFESKTAREYQMETKLFLSINPMVVSRIKALFEKHGIDSD